MFEQIKQQRVFLEIIKNNDVLLGILLGFGKKNAQSYAEGEIKKMGFFPKESDKISTITLPEFRAHLNDPETLVLRDRYLKCRTKIKEVFLDQNILEQTLEFLIIQESAKNNTRSLADLATAAQHKREATANMSPESVADPITAHSQQLTHKHSMSLIQSPQVRKDE